MDLNTFTESILTTLSITEKTYKNYRSSYNVNIRPVLGDKEINAISKAEFADALALLKPPTRYQALMVLRTIFREALERELVDSNIPATIKTPRVQVKKQKFLTWEELEQIDFGFHHKRIRFLALHGLRYGEAAALTADDIKDGYVHITKSKHGATKTAAGVRKVPLMCEFVPFPRDQKRIAAALKPYGVTVHSLRKTYAYTLKQANVHVTTAAKLMGHSNPLVTMKVYTLVLDDEIHESGNSLRGYLNREYSKAS